MNIPEEYIQRIRDFPARYVSLGIRSILLVEPSELPEAQVGYSRDAEGNDLVQKGRGFWRRHWIVIGSEGSCGDPIILDTSKPELPVRTAPHGSGSWKTSLISDTLAGFFSALSYILSIADGRENPVALRENPIPKKVLVRTMKLITRETNARDLWFWSDWLSAS